VIRCEWGLHGVETLGRDATVIIVDVLSFSTAVCVAVERGAYVSPSLAAPPPRSQNVPSLSPQSMMRVEAGARITLPSPNGSTLSFRARSVAAAVTTACLRNARAVALWAASQARPIVVIPAGERWPDGSIRFAIEDWLGAGAVIASLPGPRSPEALAAEQAFLGSASIDECLSARELVERGFADDVRMASAVNVSETVPVLGENGFHDALPR
jgi:2-phosphosulfolactate phosphatase